MTGPVVALGVAVTVAFIVWVKDGVPVGVLVEEAVLVKVGV